MKVTRPHFPLNYGEGSDYNAGEENDGISIAEIQRECSNEFSDVAKRLQCICLDKCESTKRGEELPVERCGMWRQGHKNKATKLEEQLNSRWEPEELIEEQLNSFNAHYIRTMVPTKLKDVAQILMPKWDLPQEFAFLAWLGDWRPSAILELLRSLARCSFSFSSLHSTGSEHLLSKIIHDVRIEEAIIDGEMAEIQATCILHFPFDQEKNKRSRCPVMGCLQSEFQKIGRVITKAQQLRFKALELVVKKVLSNSDAAEFLMAFAGIQDAIHQFAGHHKLQKVPLSVPVKALWSSQETKAMVDLKVRMKNISHRS